MKMFQFSLALTLVLTSVSHADWKVSRDKSGVAVSEDDQPVFYFQRAMKRTAQGTHGRANYLHPVYDTRGSVLTEDFPADHPHHRGIFWAWHQLWIGKKKIGDPWATVATDWRVRKVTTQQRSDGTLVLHSLTDVSSPQFKQAGKQTPYMTERVWVRAHPLRDGKRVLDFDIHLHALVPGLKIGGSENDKGYGGFSVRMKLPKGLVFRGQGGQLTPIRTAVPAGPWVDFSGQFHSGKTSGVTILVHPASPGFPQGWLLRTSRSMQNPAYPGQHPVGIERGKPLKLRYRVVIHEGKRSTEEVNGWWNEYASTSPIAGSGNRVVRGRFLQRFRTRLRLRRR